MEGDGKGEGKGRIREEGQKNSERRSLSGETHKHPGLPSISPTTPGFWSGTRRRANPLSLVEFCVLLGKQLGTVFEMHRIIMVPFSSPNEAVPFKDFYDAVGDSISVRNGWNRTPATGPAPIVRVRRVNVDSDPEGVCA